MKSYYRAIVSVSLCAVLLCAGCASKQPSTAPEPSHNSEILGEYEISAEAQETGNPQLQEMTAENKAYYDKYIKMWGLYPVLEKNFDAEHPLTEFDTNLMYYAIASAEGKAEEYATAYGLAIPAKVVEDTIQSHFAVTTEQIRKNTPQKAEGLYDYYDPATRTYCFSGGYGGGANSAIVTSASRDDKVLTLFCDWYSVEGAYLSTSRTDIQLEANGGFRYLSNECTEDDSAGMEKLRTTYLYPVFIAGMLNRSWTDPTELDPGSFSLFFTTLDGRGVNLSDYPLDKNSDPMVPAEEFERTIRQYFDVSTERLRASEYYRADTKTYPSFGLGGASDCKVTAVRQDENRLALDYELIYDGLLVTDTGTLSLDLASDGSYNYLSNRVAQNPQVNTKAGKFIFDVGFYRYGEIVEQAYAVFYHNRSGYASAAELQEDDLFSFFLNFYETPEEFYQEDANNYRFPVSAVTDFLDQYFEGYSFDIGEVTFNVAVEDGMVTFGGFAGLDTLKQQINVTAVTIIAEDQLRIDANLMDVDDSEKVADTTNVTIRVTDTGYHILSLNR